VVQCGKGTYIRSLARDLGERLGCGAYLDGLRRTRVGPFTPADAVPLDVDEVTARSRLLPPAAAVAGLPHVRLPPDAIGRLRHGQAITADGDISGNEVAVFDAGGALVAVAATAPNRVLRPVKVFPA
jgi:tRNA pseudouridine55 synthase